MHPTLAARSLSAAFWKHKVDMMAKLSILVAVGLLVCASSSFSKQVAPAVPPVYNLVWSDEFDGDAIDLKKWVIADRNITNYDGGINHYDPANVYVENGNLVIRSLPANNPGAKHAPAYGSGRATTKKRFAFLYGKVEVRAKLPGTLGLWPAIWLLPDDGSWPPEIDMMELLGNVPTRIIMSHHWGSKKQDLHDQTEFDGPDFTQDFHVFSIEWQPGLIRWLVDGVERKAVTSHVPNKAMYLILNTSVGGDWPGMPDASTIFPAYLQIDYVRIYQQPKKHR